MRHWLIILQLRIHLNKIENRIIFRIKTGYYLKLLTPETMKLFRSTKNRIMKNKNWRKCISFRKNWSKFTVILSTMIIKMIQESCIHLFQINLSVIFQLLGISPKKIIFLKTFNSGYSNIEIWFARKRNRYNFTY